MQSLYKIKTAKFFEKVKKKDSSTEAASLDEDPFSITHITLCTESRLLAIAGKITRILKTYSWIKKHKSIFKKFTYEKFINYFNFSTCIFPDYMGHESSIEFWKNSCFENMTAGFLKVVKIHFGKIALKWCMKKNVFD